MSALATAQQGSNGVGSERLHVLIWVAALLVITSWGVRVSGQLQQGYKDSGDVLDKRERLVALAREKEDLTDEVAHARTDEGRAEQIKVLFGAGDPRDVLLEVHVETGASEEPPVVGLGERTRDSIRAGVDAFVMAWHRIFAVWTYWAGQNPAPPPMSDESNDAAQL